MSVLRPAPVRTSQLTWVPEDRQYVGEISSTRGFGRVYDDACDEGLTLVSARTGREVVFVVTDVARDIDYDVIFWTLRPATPGVRPCSLILFND